MGTRIVTAVAALVSAYVHLKLWLDGFSDIDMIGPAFMFNAVAGLVIAILLLAWKHWVPGFLAAGFGASTLGAFIRVNTMAPGLINTAMGARVPQTVKDAAKAGALGRSGEPEEIASVVDFLVSDAVPFITCDVRRE